MLSDGLNTFTWNARNQVFTLNGVSPQYDAYGRRSKNLAGTSFLYDGVNDIQELSGSTVTANNITGGVDEFFTRMDSASYYPITDALGSVIALTNSSGGVVTSYTYDPYGNTTISGTANSNVQEYTGRENDGNGLYYYRARYYEPTLGRFISEDPIGFAAGLNKYRYVHNNPIQNSDASGNGEYPCGMTFALQHPGVPCPISSDGDPRLPGAQTVNVMAHRKPPESCAGFFVAWGGMQTDGWGNPKTLQDHFNRHGSDFGSKTPSEYAQQGQDLLINSQQQGLPTKIGPDGKIIVYDPSTNQFGVYNADGTTKTCFRPSRGADYFNDQEGVEPVIPGATDVNPEVPEIPIIE